MDLVYRPRRLRRSASIRGLVRETELSPRQLIYPMFVTEGKAVRECIETMPGQFRLSIDELLRECEEGQGQRRVPYGLVKRQILLRPWLKFPMLFEVLQRQSHV